ncbi:MAG: transketolase C-terminal domain-containing protein [Nanoarchaeota archaeon]
MGETLRNTICRISQEHIEKNNGTILGECLIDGGRVRGTVPDIPEHPGIMESPMSDLAIGYVACGHALAGRKPILVVRFQGFNWFNIIGSANYAAKSKEMSGIPCPIFIRSVAMDGGFGPVASGSHYGLIYRMPGIKIAAPSTPKEYESVWNNFIETNDPIYVSEHRATWDIDYELEDSIEKKADITILSISSTRLNALNAKKRLSDEGITTNLIHLPWIKPLDLNKKNDLILESLLDSKYGGLVTEGDYPAAAAKNIAYDLMHKTGKRVYALGLEEKTAGFAPHLDNFPATPERIYNKIKEIVCE